MKSRMILVFMLVCMLTALAAQGGQHHANFPPSGSTANYGNQGNHGNQGSHGSVYDPMQQIEQRLQLWESLYLRRLKPAEQRRARALINEIRVLLYRLPGNQYGYWQPQPMDDSDFTNLRNRVRRTSFGDSKLHLLRLAATENYFSSAQIATLLGLFSFSADRLVALEILYPQCVDTRANYVILDAFTFSADKARAVQIMSG
ncbi:MAG: DUF4476 domain-containing protein [Candidatus Syntrophosphaera sp.]|nr:DUF4476 domain-containing protein [Candidatus Syntrophosphaera sp.]